jgi:hypothetical protein
MALNQKNILNLLTNFLRSFQIHKDPTSDIGTLRKLPPVSCMAIITITSPATLQYNIGWSVEKHAMSKSKNEALTPLPTSLRRPPPPTRVTSLETSSSEQSVYNSFQVAIWPTVPTSSFRNVNENMILHMLWHHWCTWPHAPKRISPLWLEVQ